MEPNFYELLEVSRNASTEVIDAAWRKLLARNHPDRGGETEVAKVLNEAHRVLADSFLRAEYDLELRTAAEDRNDFGSESEPRDAGESTSEVPSPADRATAFRRLALDAPFVLRLSVGRWLRLAAYLAIDVAAAEPHSPKYVWIPIGLVIAVTLALLAGHPPLRRRGAATALALAAAFPLNQGMQGAAVIGVVALVMFGVAVAWRRHGPAVVPNGKGES
ncbi:MAG: J domain-containing protein [Acidimicrobiales bacterium]